MDEKMSWTISYLAEHNLEADLTDAYVHAGDLLEETDERPFAHYGIQMKVPPQLSREVLDIMEDVLPAIDASLYGANVHISKLVVYSPIQKLDGKTMEKIAAVLSIMTIIAECVTDVIFEHKTYLDPQTYIYGLSKKDKKRGKIQWALQEWQAIHAQVQQDFGL